MVGGLLTAYFSPKGGAGRSTAEWEDRFGHWRNPASRSEEEKIARTARMIRNAIDARGGMLSECVVMPKGSYHSNTNVRANSDMDIAVVHPSVVRVSECNEQPSETLLGLFGTVQTNGEVFDRMRAELEAALYVAFGYAGVTPGNKAIAVHANPGTRVDADVVPSMRLWNIRPSSEWTSLWAPSYHEGIVLFPREGGMIINYPAQAHIDGVAKNNATGRRYKRVVRILKRMRDELMENFMLSTLLGQDAPPSFLIECMCHNVPDHVYNGPTNYYDLVVGTLCSIRDGIDAGNHFVETNGIKPLFAETGHYAQPWMRAAARRFCATALAWMGA
jgi:hypothetical protein